MNWSEDFIEKILCGDCLEILKEIPSKTINAVITDPPWPGTKVKFVDQEQKLFTAAAVQIARLSNRLVVHLGSDTDPRFLESVPVTMPFVRACWLRYVPVRYKGPILYDADIAYVFGDNFLPGKGIKVMGSESLHVSKGYRYPGDTHPTPRALEHALFLVRNFSRENEIVLDPFCGSGVILKACKMLNRRFIGIDINSEYCEIAKKKLHITQRGLFCTPAKVVQGVMKG